MLRQTGNQDGLLGQSILMKQWNIRDLTLGGLFTALIGVGAFLKITIPVQPVPMHFTLQFFFVLLAALLLGSKRAYVSVLTYLVIGLCGIPVFATGGGPAYLLKPTFGFLIGFAAAAYVTGRVYEIRKSTSFSWLLFSAFWGLLADYGCGDDLFLCVQQFCPWRKRRMEGRVCQLLSSDGR